MQWLDALVSALYGADQPLEANSNQLGLGHETCPINSPPSCSIHAGQDSCCYEATNGLFLQTQFWDYDPATGGNETWTLHGLWSDKCLGGFNQFCNPSWEINDAEQILKDAQQDELLDKMKEYWRNLSGDDASLWLHEFNKHGTCMATVSPDCYHVETPKYQYVVDFYKSVMRLYETLPSYEFLTNAGIYPDEDRTHTLEEWNQVLGSHVGNKKVYLGCDRSNAITEIWYFYTLQGAVSTGIFSPADTISTSTCRDGFKWLPKNMDKKPRPRPGPNPGRGKHLTIEGQTGCLISDGTWYKDGTCATFRVKETVGGIQLSSSKGPCAIKDGRLLCAKTVSASDFTQDSDGYLLYGGESQWSSTKTPSKWGRVPVYTGDKGNMKFKIKITG